MLKSRKHVFWEALIITIAIFVIGLFLGMMVETGRSSEINDFYMQSEVNLIDAMALSQISNEKGADCETLRQRNIEFADKIYEEAKLLELYEGSGKLTGSTEVLHRKYDLLRTLAWISNLNALEECDNYNVITYLYEYEAEDTTKRATQSVWSRILLDVKHGDENLVLIPIAVDQDLTSLDVLLEEMGITSFPAVAVNKEKVFYELETAEQIKEFLD